MTVVIDVGCARHHTSFSIERLVEMFHPDMLYGFDPNDTARTEVVDGCEVEVFQAAAWTSDGTVPFRYEEITSRVDEGAADLQAEETSRRKVDVDEQTRHYA